MNNKILKLLESKNEGDNIVGLVLFKKTKATQKELCNYMQERRPAEYVHWWPVISKYFMNYLHSSKPIMKYKWRKLLK